MSTCEAYNVVKAAEDGKSGNPEDYRDYRIPKPCNMLFHTDVPVAIQSVTEDKARYVPLGHSGDITAVPVPFAPFKPPT